MAIASSKPWLSEENARLKARLEDAGVLRRTLTEQQRNEAEQQWRAVYGSAFRGRPRLRQGLKADFEYSKQPPCRWLVVPLSSEVEGTSVNPLGNLETGYECEGPLVPLGVYNIEFAVAPTDLSWTMLYTHEDHALGGPYFIRLEWLLP